MPFRTLASAKNFLSDLEDFLEDIDFASSFSFLPAASSEFKTSMAFSGGSKISRSSVSIWRSVSIYRSEYLTLFMAFLCSGEILFISFYDPITFLLGCFFLVSLRDI